MAEALARAADGLAQRTARLTTRRRFLRRIGAIGLGATTAAVLGNFRLAPAFGYGTAKHPCGPSPLCRSSWCANGLCDQSAGCKYQRWEKGVCVSSAHNARTIWAEDYRSQGKGWWQCMDCCCPHAKGGRCKGKCGGKKYKCICRFRIG
jgi:hypothetical protein